MTSMAMYDKCVGKCMMHNPTFIPYNDMATIIILFNPSKYPGNGLGLTWLLKSEKNRLSKYTTYKYPQTNSKHKKMHNFNGKFVGEDYWRNIFLKKFGNGLPHF